MLVNDWSPSGILVRLNEEDRGAKGRQTGAVGDSRLHQPDGDLTRAYVRADAISHWDELTDQWLVEQGEWTVQIGIDSRTFYGQEKFTIDKELPWTGI